MFVDDNIDIGSQEEFWGLKNYKEMTYSIQLQLGSTYTFIHYLLSYLQIVALEPLQRIHPLP